MRIAGQTVLAAARDDVRALLQSREVLGRLVPASRELRPAGPGAFEGEVVVGVPPFAKRFPVRLTAAEQGDQLRLSAVGTSGEPALRLDVRCTLSPGGRPGTTALAYELTGELGALERLLTGSAGQRLLAGFFAGLQDELAARR